MKSAKPSLTASANSVTQQYRPDLATLEARAQKAKTVADEVVQNVLDVLYDPKNKREEGLDKAKRDWNKAEVYMEEAKQFLADGNVAAMQDLRIKINTVIANIPTKNTFFDNIASVTSTLNYIVKASLLKTLGPLEKWQQAQRRILVTGPALVQPPSPEERANGDGPRDSQTSATVLGAAGQPDMQKKL